MTAAVQQLLNSFDALSAEEQKQAAAELLRCATVGLSSELSNEELVYAAEQAFLTLDADEAAHGGT